MYLLEEEFKMDTINQFFTTNGTESEPTIYMTLLAMLTATALSLIITKIYQITFTGERYSQSFVHTIIMMSVIVSVVMNVISGDAGVAFGFFTVFFLFCFYSSLIIVTYLIVLFFYLYDV